MNIELRAAVEEMYRLFRIAKAGQHWFSKYVDELHRRDCPSAEVLKHSITILDEEHQIYEYANQSLQRLEDVMHAEMNTIKVRRDAGLCKPGELIKWNINFGIDFLAGYFASFKRKSVYCGKD
jgi:hypothetical protein